MLFTTLRNCSIQATDGNIGHVEDLIVDTRTWQVRYLVADTHRWLAGTQVLLAARTIDAVDTPHEKVNVTLTQAEIKDSPDYASTFEQPSSNDAPDQRMQQYGSWTLCLGGQVPLRRWPHGVTALQQSLSDQATDVPLNEPRKLVRLKDEAHLVSLCDLIQFRVLCKDGEVGHVQDFIISVQVDDVLYPLINNHTRWPDNNIVLPLEWIKSIESGARFVSLHATREQVMSAPAFDFDLPLESALERRQFEQTQLPLAFLNRSGKDTA